MEKIKKNKISNKGITLIALVITIIVLLILVGVTLSTLSGQDGILNKATTAADKTNKEAIKEKIQLEIFDCYDNNNDFSMDKLQGKLSKKYENVKYYANGSIILPIDKYFAMIKEESGNGKYFAGICPYLEEGGLIWQCHNLGNISVSTSVDYSGSAGICCNSSSSVENSIKECCNSGNITVKELSTQKNCRASGIIIHWCGGNMDSCYNTGTIKLISENPGDNCPVSSGIVGQLAGQAFPLKNCYNKGEMILETDNEMGKELRRASIVGSVHDYEQTIPALNCFWLTGTASKGIGQIGGEQSDTTIEKSVEELKKLTENELGDAFTADTIGINDGYPILKWQLESEYY